MTMFEQRPTPAITIAQWRTWLAGALPIFLRVLPLYFLITFLAAMVAIVLLLTVGKAAFHVFSVGSPLVFIVLALCCWKAGAVNGSELLTKAIGPGSPWRNFFRLATPLALIIGGLLNLIALGAMLSSDISAWQAGTLPRFEIPDQLLGEGKRNLLVILYTSAVEQQLSIMPLFIIMGGKVEPYLVAAMMSGRVTWEKAKLLQEGLSKRDKLILGPMRLLVICGVLLQASAKWLDATTNSLGVALLLASICGWLFYCSLVASAAQDLVPAES
ncbi:hypothetical protein M5G27_06700 [Pseudomonas shahriarae]|uniref:Transmembrane protein n=2 Tax=Pseudomonas TaxID=286 RepID=A0A9X4BYW4_9PSED|nr:hypothetical protein [Pseudomonas shahriarae]MDD1007167.1 hypothetical protein [Pseudomonas shahriarae]